MGLLSSTSRMRSRSNLTRLFCEQRLTVSIFNYNSTEGVFSNRYLLVVDKYKFCGIDRANINRVPTLDCGAVSCSQGDTINFNVTGSDHNV